MGAQLQGHTIVCGLDGLGLRIVEQLYGFGEAVIVIGRIPDSHLSSVLQAWGIQYRVAGASVADALHDAGVATAAAVVCVDPHDVVNLEIALLARSVREDLRVVVRLANSVVRDAVDAGNGLGAVLEVADLAAPSLVQDCLRRQTHAFTVAGIDFLVSTTEVTADATLRELYGDLGPVAVVRVGEADLAKVIACPGRDLEVSPGDFVALIGTVEEFHEHHLALGTDHGPSHEQVRRTRFSRIRMALHALREDADPNFFRALAVLGSLVIVSAVILRVTYQKPGMSFLDAVYFAVTTIATVGYGDFNFLGEPALLRIYAIFMMMCGVTGVAVLVAFLSDLLVSRRMTHSAGKRQARSLRNHIVVVGLGVFGMRVAKDLKAHGKDVVVIESSADNRFLAAAAEMDVPVVFGDATLRETLDAAGLARASAVAVLTANDMVNIETAIVVRDMLGDRFAGTESSPPVPVVMRVFDRPLGRVIAQRFGFQYVRSTVELAAPWFIGAAEGLDVIGTFSVWQQSFMIGAVTVEAGGGLEGVPMRGLSAATRVVAIAHVATGQIERNPRRDSRFNAGDVAYLVGPYTELMAVLRRGRASQAQLGRT